MKHFDPNLSRRRKILLGALALAVLLPTVCCIVLATREFRLCGELSAARAEIERLSAPAAPDVSGAPDDTPDSAPDGAAHPADPPADAPTPDDAAQDDTLPAAPEYQALYPDLYSEHPVGEQTVTEKVCYLTFDDGPSAQTPVILDILDKYQIKATFFVVGTKAQNLPDTLRDVAARGHTVGIHTNTHVYKDIYASVDAYLGDFYTVWQSVYELTGVKPEVFRFPGGSINQYNKGLYQPLIAEMLRRGFAYYDWNASAEDAVGKPTAQSVVEQALKTKSQMPIVLMHDGGYSTATAEGLPKIIEGFRSRGYSFGVLTPDVYSIAFGYKD